MKKIFYSLFAVITMMCAVECSAQTDIWAWQNGQYTKFEKADSVTFINPTAYPTVADSNIIDGHEYVDLGLPSGTKWATCNVGASKPTEYGEYFAWGETSPKENYKFAAYKYEAESYKSLNDGDGSWTGCNKYTVADEYNQYADSVAWYDKRGNFIGDSLTTLLAEDDAATANWGSGWRMPTKGEQDELRDGCNWKWTDDFNGSGVAGYVGTSKTNGNTIFLPAAGRRDGTELHLAGRYGYYWSSTLRDFNSSAAFHLYFYTTDVEWHYNDRYEGESVRAVVTMTCTVDSSAQKDFWIWQNGQYTKLEKADSITFVDPEAVPANIIDGHEYVDLGLPSGLKWATCNVGASKPTEYGDYFAWGETTPKEDYTWATYKYEAESYKSLNDGGGSWEGCSKYTIADWNIINADGDVDSVAWYDSNGNFIGDSLTTLLAEDDAATVNWGSDWRMPTKAEWDELVTRCNWEWTDDFNGSGVAGRIGTSKTNGNTIFLPAAGKREGTYLDLGGDWGYYWSSSLEENFSYFAYDLLFFSEAIGRYSDRHYVGECVRAVVK